MLIGKDARITGELNQLAVHNKKLYKLARLMSDYAEFMWGIDLTITSILRTQEENDELYKNTPVADRPKNPSPHLTWEAFDLRSRDLTPTQKDSLCKIANLVKRKDGKVTMFIHAIAGGAEHAHAQLPRPGS